MKKYDVLVIGTGGGGKLISPCARLGLKVAAIEKAALGGTCLNRGCIPSKMLIHPADVASELKSAAKFDLQVNTTFSVNFTNLIQRISKTVDSDSASIAVGYGKNSNIDFYPYPARFVADKVVSVNGETITADKIFIAVGARPFIPEIPGLAGTPFLTSTEALRNTRLPQKMIVVGGGYIAVELGYAYAALGTEVHFLVRSKLLRHEDTQVADEFHRVFAKQHHIHTGATLTQVQHLGQQFTVSYSQEGQSRSLIADALLMASGITPNTDQLGLENTRIGRKPDGYIKVNEYLETAVPGVYALGDCVGNYLFRHSVNFEGEYLMRTLFVEKKREPLVYPPVPHAIFSNPQVAGVGKTEEDLKREGIPYVVGLNSYQKSAMGMALLSDSGFVKILIDRGSRKILGAHIVGDEASNMIHMLIALMYKQGSLDDLLGMIYIHPALPEIVRNAARNAQAEFEKLAK